MFFTGYQASLNNNAPNQNPAQHDKDVNVEEIGWIKKFLYPYALDPAPIKTSDYPIQGPTLGSV